MGKRSHYHLRTKILIQNRSEELFTYTLMDLNAFFFPPLIGDEPKWSWTGEKYTQKKNTFRIEHHQMKCNFQRLNHLFAGKKKINFNSSIGLLRVSARVCELCTK